jgi:hypothetical protein
MKRVWILSKFPLNSFYAGRFERERERGKNIEQRDRSKTNLREVTSGLLSSIIWFDSVRIHTSFSLRDADSSRPRLLLIHVHFVQTRSEIARFASSLTARNLSSQVCVTFHLFIFDLLHHFVRTLQPFGQFN